MGPFEYVRARDVAAAVALVSADPQAQYLAGGTTQIDLMLKDGIVSPERLPRHGHALREATSSAWMPRPAPRNGSLRWRRTPVSP